MSAAVTILTVVVWMFITRMVLDVLTTFWRNSLYDRLQDLRRAGTYTQFHDLLRSPRPWYVRVHNWLNVRGI